MSLSPRHWPHKLKLVVAFAAVYTIWGSTYLAIRIGLQAEMPPSVFAGMRLTAAGLLLLLISKLRGRSIRIPFKEYRIVATVGLFLLVGGLYFTYLAEQSIPSSLSALIVALLPLWASLVESFLPDMDSPTSRGVTGIIVGFIGLGILLAPRLTGIHGTTTELVGVGMQVCGTWLWTTGSIISKRNPVKTDSMVATGYELLSAGVVLLTIGTIRGEWPLLTLTPAGFGALAYLTLIGSCVAFSAFIWLLRNVPASKVMTYAFVNPVIAVFLGWLVLREPIDAWMLAGMATIVTGVALTTTAPPRADVSPALDPSAETSLAAEDPVEAAIGTETPQSA